MALRTILHFPHARLRDATAPISAITDEIQALIDDMFETMYHADGIGLAATQIGIAKQIAVIDVGRDQKQPLVLINPEIIGREGLELMSEGCLSVPGHYDKVKRALKVTFRAKDRNNQTYEMQADGLLAHCVQHEIDHLMGKLYIDYLSEIKRNLIRKKLKKHEKHCSSC